jgi:hypothetical protein
MLSKPFFKICVTSVTKLNDLYTTIPSTEIWSTHLVDNTLNQIKYYAQGGMFKTKSDIIIIINQLSSLMKDLQAAAKTGHKSFKDGRIGSSFNLYHNEITHTNNVILLDSHSKKFAFATYDNPNYMETSHTAFWNYSFEWFSKLQQRSHSVSQQSERNRLILFNMCQAKINKLKLLIKGIDFGGVILKISR